MKKLTLLIAALVLSFTAQATVVNCNPGTNNLSWYLTQGDTLVLADGEYEEAYSITFNQPNACIKAAEGAKPVIKLTAEWASFKLAATTTFEGITFDGGGLAYYPIATEGENTGIFTFNNCVFKNYLYYAISNNNATTQTNINSIIVNNCLFHDGGSAIYMNDKAACANITVQNTTIYNFAGADKYKAAIHIDANATDATLATQTLLDHLTIYNIQTSSSIGAITIENASETTISNCIIASPEQKYIDSYNVPAEATIQNCLVHNQHLDADWTSIITNADPMFVDAANGNFMLYAESPAVGAGTDGSDLGDPRWGVKAGIQPGEGKLKDAVDAAQPGDVIVLGDETYEVSSSISCDVEGLTIKAAEGTKPIISFTGTWSSLKLSATTTFEGIIFDGGNVVNYPITTEGENTGIFTFNNCVFKNYLYYAISNNNATTQTNINSIIVNNCTFHDGGSAIYMNDQAACANITIQNTTIYNIQGTDKYKAAIHVNANATDATLATQTLLDHLTIYNIQTSSSVGAITIANASKTTISNCIIASPEQKSIDSYNVPAEATVQNCLVHNQHLDDVWNSIITKADPLFVDAANANFMLSANSPAIGAGTNGSNLGDTRWGVSAKVLGKRINVTPDQASSLAWIIQNDASDLQPGDTLVLADGQYTLSTIEFIKENLVVMAAENAKPEIISASEWANLEISANTTFDGITFNGNDVAQFLISIQDSTTMKTKLVLQNCELKNWKKWAISNQYSDNVVVDSLIIDNCLFHDGLGSAIRFSEEAPEGEHACNYFKMTNSTIYNVVSTEYAAVVELDANGKVEGDQNEVTIDHITLYNYDAADLGAIYVAKTSNLSITNSIIATPEDKGQRALYVYGGTVDNTIHFNGSKRSGNTVYTNCLTDDPLFVDAANGNFMVYANSPAIGKATDGSNLGDPRWGVKEITLTTGDNSQVIADNINKAVNVKIERSFTANDGYYTLCVPFNMPASVIGKAYSLGTITKHVTGEGINIELKEENMLSAGMPYLVLPKANMSELVVENVTIAEDGVAGQGVEGSQGVNVQIFFQGYYSAPAAPENQTNGTTQYYVGNNGYLYNDVVDIRGLCGLFTITDKEGNPTKVRARVVTREEVETGLDNNQLPNTHIQKVLENGQLIIIRDGVKYNVQGQVIK